jgi:hypothetical protein
MLVRESTEAAPRLSLHPSPSPLRRTDVRVWILALAREATQFCRTAREAGDRANALRWLRLAADLRTSAGVRP